MTETLQTTANGVPAPDATDQAIIALLRKDGRMAYRALAREIGLTEATVRARIRRLEENNLMRVVAVTDYEAAGYNMLLAVGIQVEGRPPGDVAGEIARFPEAFVVCQVVGSIDIEMLVVAEDQDSLNELLYERLAAVPGVRRILPSIALDVLKNQPNWVPFKNGGQL